MNSNFWNHLINAASAVVDMNRQSAAERAEARAEKGSKPRKKKAAAPERESFNEPPPAADCCVTKRRFKLGG